MNKKTEKNVTTIKKPQDHKVKKPTKKELFDNTVKRVLEIAIENYYKEIESVEDILEVGGYIQNVYTKEELDKIDNIFDEVDRFRKSKKAFINTIKLTVDSWTYKKFMDIKEIPVETIKFPIDEEIKTYDVVDALYQEKTIKDFVEKIQTLQRQLLNCD